MVTVAHGAEVAVRADPLASESCFSSVFKRCPNRTFATGQRFLLICASRPAVLLGKSTLCPPRPAIFSVVQTYPLVSALGFPDRMSACVPAQPSTQEGREGPPILEHRGKSPYFPRSCSTPRPLSGRDQRFPTRLMGKGHHRLRRAALRRTPAGSLPGRPPIARTFSRAWSLHSSRCPLHPTSTPVGGLLAGPRTLARASARLLLVGPSGFIPRGHPLGDCPQRLGRLQAHRPGQRMASPSPLVRPHGAGRSPGW